MQADSQPNRQTGTMQADIKRCVTEVWRSDQTTWREYGSKRYTRRQRSMQGRRQSLLMWERGFIGDGLACDPVLVELLLLRSLLHLLVAYLPVHRESDRVGR